MTTIHQSIHRSPPPSSLIPKEKKNYRYLSFNL